MADDITWRKLTIGSFQFSDFEIPESIPFGGEQRLAVKKLVGGARVVDAMGSDPVSPSWSGIFLGPQAMARAMQLRTMWESGQVYILQWDQLQYQVVIQSFMPDYKKANHIPYHITLLVVQDNTNPNPPSDPNVTSDVNTDLYTANSLTSTLGLSSLTAPMAALSSAIAAVSDFAKATQSVINSVLQPLASMQAQVTLLIASTEKTLQNVSTVGGLVPNNPIAKSVAQMGNYVAAATQQPNLINLSNVLGRMGSNIGQVNSSVRTITVPGGNLYEIASKQYGDASAWKAIANANPALKGDPQLNGITTLVIPPYHKPVGGIL